ncbi:MAG: 1-deoxy-D-xylulose-5-phosphate synthase [Clostridiaceae bacterium]
MYEILSKYKGPDSLKSMSIEELDKMAEEIRQFLVEKVSKTGGHLAPNLGVVELTIALHNVFDFTEDKLVFDVGHQSYVHKILTGRMDRFDTLRRYKGLSGFPKTEESLYDHFNTGHASTSISAATGIARARDIKGEDYSVVCVIGDGALTGGMVWEAINDIGFRETKVIIVLNDNEMSISRNVGSMSLYLSNLRSNIHYENFKRRFQKRVEKFPLGKELSGAAKWMKNSVKAMVVEGMLFENMGLKYLGPVDGHNIKDMSRILKSARDYDGPVIVHAITQKGRGYNFAVEKPDKFHGVGPFDTVNGNVLSSGNSYSGIFGETLMQMAEKNPKITAITAAMRDGTGLSKFAARYPDRFFDVGIAEEHAVTMAGGMAINGLNPYVAIYSTFLQRSLDQLIHDVCLQKLNVKFCIDRAGIVGDDGETHQGVFDISYLSMIPNMTIVAPKCLEELKNILLWSESFNGPLAIRYPRGGDDKEIELKALTHFEPGNWEMMKEGKDGVIIGTGKTVGFSLKASQILAEQGIDMGVVNAVFIKPLDVAMLKDYLSQYSFIATVEDNEISGGLGDGILQKLTEGNYKGKVVNIGYNDTFIEQGSVNLIYDDQGLSPRKIAERIKSELQNG